MKTYKQMAERVLKRRDEYFAQKQDRKASRGVISAAVTACAVVVVILFGTIIGGVMKSPVTTPETDAPPSASSPGSTEITAEETETKPEDTDDTEREATAEITEETAEEKTGTDTLQESSSNDPVRTIEYLHAPDPSVTVERLSCRGTYLYGYECKDVISYTLRYNTTREGGKHGDRVRIMIRDFGGNTELLSPGILTLDIPDGKAEFDLKFRYTEDNVTLGHSFKIYTIDDLYADIYNEYNDFKNFGYLQDEKSISDGFEETEMFFIRYGDYDFFEQCIYFTDILNDLKAYFDDPKPMGEIPDKNTIPVEYIPAPDPSIVIHGKNYTEISGYECKDVVSYTIRYNTTRSDGRHGKRVRVIIWHSDGVEMISPDILTLDMPDGTARFEVKFRYKDNHGLGKFHIFCIDERDVDIDNNFNEVPVIEKVWGDTEFLAVSKEISLRAVRAKGYDFLVPSIDTARVYYDIAIGLGDVDEDGIPLYFSDPYMPDYYDCEACQRLRQEVEESEEFITEH